MMQINLSRSTIRNLFQSHFLKHSAQRRINSLHSSSRSNLLHTNSVHAQCRRRLHQCRWNHLGVFSSSSSDFLDAPRQQLFWTTRQHSSLTAESSDSGTFLDHPTNNNISILNDNAEDIMRQIPLQDVRNFCFIAHVDHGKSSLSSRILELTGNLGPDAQKIAQEAVLANQQERQPSTSSSSPITNNKPKKSNVNAVTSDSKEQYELLDTLSVEKERGITVKASTATMLYPHPSAVGPTGCLLLNMIDTPGHVDFGREVVRSLSFVQGAVLLLDASQGIQAQTWTVCDKARSMSDNPPQLILALTKVDLDAARPVHVALTASEWLNWEDPDDIILTSARSRFGIAQVLDRICTAVPPPTALADDAADSDYEQLGNNLSGNNKDMTLRAQVVDSWYDDRGVNCLVQVVSGSMAEGDRIVIVGSNKNDGNNLQNQQSYSVQEIGMVLPQTSRTKYLGRGQMGYVRFGLRDPRQAQPGTVLILQKHISKEMILPVVPNAQDITKSVLYASVHPGDSDGFDELVAAVDRLALNDTGLELSRTAALSGSERGGPFLGPGLKVGFQGILHMEVFRQRLLDEFDIEAIVTPPKVPYKIIYKEGRRTKSQPACEPITEIIEDLAQWPGQGVRFSIEEPMVSATIMAPVDCTGAVMDLISRRRGIGLESKPIDEETWIFTAQMPWAEVVVDFHDQLKNVTAGFGSLDTVEGDPPFRQANVHKVEILLNNEVVEPLAFVCHKDHAHSQGRSVCKKLQEVLPRQQFVVVIQAKADGRIIASERIKAFRKDVLMKSGKLVGGGDMTRKKKLLENQKKGKKKLAGGRVALSQAAFNSVISSRSFSSAATSSSDSSHAKLRIVAINDVYELANLPKLQTFLRQLQPKATSIVLAGDFLSPSTLSSIDGGRGMVATLRAVGLTHACLGNHEADLHWPMLQNRLQELTAKDKVTLVNTNVRKPPPASKLAGTDGEWMLTKAPPYAIVPSACGRVNIALLGLLSDEPSVFRDHTFRGAPIGNVLTAYQESYAEIVAGNLADLVIPMTHMSLSRDKELARCMLELQPQGVPSVVIGGHEHEPYDIKVFDNREIDAFGFDRNPQDASTSSFAGDDNNYIRILKSGCEAEAATLIDLTFDADAEGKPLIDLQADIVSMKPYEPSVVVQKIVDEKMSVVDTLNNEMIVHAETLLPPGTPLSSQRSRFQQTTVGAILCKAIKDELESVDVCMINGATIKGNKLYENDQISYADLKKELPFPTKMVIVPMKRWELMEAIHYSRTFNEEGAKIAEGEEVPRRGYLQVDLDFDGDAMPVMLDDTVRVCLPRNLLNGFCRIEPLMAVGKQLKEEGKFPGSDDFVPAILYIVRHFCKATWLDIVKESISFDDVDLNGDGVLDREEIKIMMEKFLGHPPPEFVVDDMIDAIDADENGVIDAGEFSFLMASMEREDLFRKL